MKEFTEDGYEIEDDGFYTPPRYLTPPRTTETTETPGAP